jgi:hypothetical protein
MAIYHLSASIIKRSAGRSVTAAAAYRAAAKIEDIKTGIIHDYGRKQGVDYSEIISPLSPNSNSSNQWLTNRAELWNKVELIEKRKDAQLAREVTIAIPTELSKPEQIALVREYVQTNYVAAGMIADINLHHLDGDNPHAHILLTMRSLQTSPAGLVEFGLKNTDWNSKELLLAQRKSWEEVANKYLAARGLDARIDCRSLEEQGSPFIPQIHVGVHAMAMKRKGIATDRGEEFDLIKAANNDIRARLEEVYQQEYTEEESEIIEEDKDTLDELGKLIDEITNNPELPEIKVNGAELFRKETQEARKLEKIIYDHYEKYENTRFETLLKTVEYNWILNLGNNHKFQNDKLKEDLTNNDIYKIRKFIYQNNPYLPIAGDPINDETRKSLRRSSYRYLKIRPGYRQATSEDKHIEFRKQMDDLSTRTLWMKNLTTEIESEIIKIGTYLEIESTRQKAEATAIKIESLAPTQQPKVTRPRPPDRKPISEGDPRVHLRAMANKTPMPTVDLINERDLTIETPPITPIPIIQKPEPTIVKSPTPSEIAVQLKQQQLDRDAVEKQRLASLVENKQVVEKSQAKRKSSRGFER